MIVDFTAPDRGTAPLTWGQGAIWDAIGKTAPDDHYFNFGRILEVPGTRTADQIATALAALVARHGALRTRLDLQGPKPLQRLADRGRLPVLLTDEDPGAVLAALTADRYDYGEEWPLRVALVTRGPRISHVVLAFCHMATDGLGSEVAVRDLRMLILRGSSLQAAPPAPSPLDLAHWQAGPDGRRTARRAAELWEGFPRRTMFDRPEEGRAQPPVWRAQLTSPALGLAVRAVAARHRTSTSTVLLAATAALVGRHTGRATCAILPIVNNRFRRDTTRIVSTLSQEGLFTLDVDRDFGALLREAEPATLRAYRSAFHDPLDRAAGDWVQPRCCFNDMRFADPGPAPCPPGDIVEALPRTRLSWPLSQEKLNCRFCVHVSGSLEVSVTADTRYLPRPGMERMLHDLEALLVAEAGAGPQPPLG
ncbi:condensation domain-containing protein [Streptacidiphilus griseoplanus]|uniref:condensation domain-containing protein n=1 Tax=Peterkaempfera griseoplana TaxID=66896 RepID=UPI0006E38804|nr:condensation domain-containing protein [Peterkaempfera griseoplana]